MANKIVLVGPTPATFSLLEDTIKAGGPGLDPVVLDHYPRREELRDIGGSPDRISAFFVDFTDERQAFRVLKDLRRVYPDVAAVVINGPRRLSKVIQAKRAGARAYVTDLHSLADLRELLVEVNLPEERQRPKTGKGRLISFVPAQGGNGASTLALHVAASVGHRVKGQTLLLDFDLHTGTVAFQLGLKPERTLLWAMTQPDLSEETIRQTVATERDLDVMVGSVDIETIETEAFRRTAELFSLLQREYRYVFVDHPAATFSSAVEVLERSDCIYLVCTPEITSLHLARRKLAHFGSYGIPIDKVRLLVNRASSWGRINTSRMEQIVGLPVDWVIENDYVSIRDAALEGGLVGSDSVLSGQFGHLALEIVSRFDFEPEAEARTVSAEQMDEKLVTVRRQWNSEMSATYRLQDVHNVHWDDTSSGVLAGYFLHAHARCDSMLEGELDHSGTHGPCPHEIKVCIVKKDNDDPNVIRLLEQQADPRPQRQYKPKLVIVADTVYETPGGPRSRQWDNASFIVQQGTPVARRTSGGKWESPSAEKLEGRRFSRLRKLSMSA